MLIHGICRYYHFPFPFVSSFYPLTVARITSPIPQLLELFQLSVESFESRICIQSTLFRTCFNANTSSFTFPYVFNSYKIFLEVYNRSLLIFVFIGNMMFSVFLVGSRNFYFNRIFSFHETPLHLFSSDIPACSFLIIKSLCFNTMKFDGMICQILT